MFFNALQKISETRAKISWVVKSDAVSEMEKSMIWKCS